MKPSFWILTAAVTALAFAQEQKQVQGVPVDGSRPLTLNAASIHREGSYPSIWKLSGQVRIVRPNCLRVAPNTAEVCEGYTVVTADEATYDETSGAIQAHGDVTITQPLNNK